MANIIQDHLEGDVVSARGTQILLHYFKLLPPHERKMANDVCKTTLADRGVDYDS